MKKRYYAYVASNMITKFEEGLRERKDNIKVLTTMSAISEKGDTLVYYELEADEGVINPRWELE